MTISPIRLTGPQAVALSDELATIYRTAFNQPPHSAPAAEVAQFARGTLPRHAARQGFRCYVVRSTPEAEVAGFVYGYTSAPGQWWHDLITAALDPSLAGSWLPGAFELVELAVDPAFQGRGFGAALHDAVLAGLPHRTAVLSTLRAETPARNLYRTRGWVSLLEPFTYGGSTAEYAIMGRTLRP